MRHNPIPLCFAVVLTSAVTPAGAESESWQVVIAKNPAVVVPGLPSMPRNYGDVLLGDAGAGWVGARLITSGYEGYWAYRNGTWMQYVKNGVTGALGPGRTGGESAHVFLEYDAGFGDAGFDGQRVFVAKAGSPSEPANGTWGVWRWDRQQNVELVRILTDGPLGPGLGAGWTYKSASTFDARSMNGGRVLVNADVTSPTNQTNRLLVMSIPGQGVQPCLLRGSTARPLAPNLLADDRFDASWSLSAIAATPGNRVYGTFSASSGEGIWEVCSGAPRPIAATGRTDDLGPDIGTATAVFASSFTAPRPGTEGSVYFFANFRPSSNESSRAGLFWNDGATNRPLAWNDAEGAYGPHWLDATWSSFDRASLMSAGRWSAFTASTTTGDGATQRGLWRVNAGGTPEPVALLHLSGDYAPAAGRTWESFSATAILTNGDILVSADTNPEGEHALWLLKRGEPPRRILVTGQTVSIRTAAGIVADTVTSFTLDTSGPALYGGGADSWVGMDGSVLVQITTATYGSARMIAVVSNPLDVIFTDGYDG